MQIAILFLSLWAFSATLPALGLPTVTQPSTPAAPGSESKTPATPAAKPPTVAPADLAADKYKVSFKLANVKYEEGLASYESGLYQNYAGKIMNALMNLYADDNAYRDSQMVAFRNDTGVVAVVTLRFANESKNLVSLDALIKTGTLGSLPVDPASLKATKDASVPPVFGMGAMGGMGGMGCPSPCGAPQACYPQCSQSCCGGQSSSMMGAPMQGMMPGMQQGMMPGMQQGMMPGMPGMMPGMQQQGMMPGMQQGMMGGAGQCPGSCPNSCAPSCGSSCCGGNSASPPMMG